MESGARVGPYEIREKIGAGGMGEVYRATDAGLRRDVAVKVLPPELASDPERLARFQREAEVLASLNHPNIAAIYGLEGAGDRKALVMELVEGPTLADRIAQGPIPVDDALPIAKQIAEALEAAHEQGVVHRDLKPANIKLRPDGTVKVLDFGLAKAMEPATAASPGMSQSPTITSPAMTQAGVILGTAAYMSPEQARGKAVDRRSDIWAFGCVLYEMLAGRAAFEGDDVTVTLARVVEREPDFDALPQALPGHVRQALRLCLRKDAKQRMGDIRDARLAMEGAFEPSGLLPGEAAPAQPQPLAKRWLPAAGLALLAASLAGAGVWVGVRPPSPRVAYFTVVVPDTDGLPENRGAIAISPDGRDIVFSTEEDRLLHRPLGQREARLVTEEPATTPFFSPDGQWLGFLAEGGGGTLKKLSLAQGSAAIPLGAISGLPYGVSWSADSSILVAQGERILRLPGDGGRAETLIEEANGAVPRFPELRPG